MRGFSLLSSLLIGVWFLSGCSSNTAPPTSSATLQPRGVSTANPFQTSTVAIRTLTPVAPPPTRSLNSAEVTFRWDVGVLITDVDDITELAVRLRDRPGILGAYGDEIQITVVYDPQQTTPEKIAQMLADLGFPVKKL